MKVKDLNVRVTYNVRLSDVEVSDEQYKALQYLAVLGAIDCDYIGSDKQIDIAMKWIRDNIWEDDACCRECEIEDMDE